MRASPDSEPRAWPSSRSLGLLMAVVLLALMLPVATAAAPERTAREYIVSVAVADSARVIKPSSRSARQRIDRRNQRAEAASERLARQHDFRTRFRYGNAFTGFSARLTPEQAAEVARDPQVTSIRPARRFRIAAQLVPDGIVRVKAYASGSPGPDVDADVAILDTGLGPSDSLGRYAGRGTPFDSELNVAGGYNCYNPTNPDRWADTQWPWHGTHVAGTIGARDNGIGTVGVAPGVRLWAVRVFQGQSGSEASIICGLDWAIGTLSTPDDIEVINMSIQGPRLDYQEDCDLILADPDGDPIHQGVCRATALGITVVAAAGNFGINANESSPGGYDQVISVGAITDYDGAGWGAAGNRGCDANERDDTYASYSNRGREIDILAPGTCVVSTSPDPSGDTVRTMTGTSMAAPHVTGAVARYLADHPGTAADKMRRIVRAAGRLDWDIKSDPRWSGINDADDPNRVLDVKALTGGDMLRSWVYHRAFRITDASTPTTRVDVQRGGGYSGPASLDLTGLPAGVGSATFVSDSLTGLDELGTKLRLELKSGGPEGDFDLGVRVNAAGVDPFSRPLSLVVDRTGPVVKGMDARLRASGAQMSTGGRSQAVISWNTSDAISGVKRTVLQRKIGTRAWRKVGTPTGSSLRVWLKQGQPNKFRIKATDGLGNTSTSKAVEARLGVRDSSSGRWLVPADGGWRTQTSRKAYGGSLRLAKDSTGSLTSTFKGKAVALVASMGPGRGTFRVRVDGGAWSTVDLWAEKAAHRQVVWGRKLPPGTHKLEVQGQKGQTALDAILFLR